MPPYSITTSIPQQELSPSSSPRSSADKSPPRMQSNRRALPPRPRSPSVSSRGSNGGRRGTSHSPPTSPLTVHSAHLQFSDEGSTTTTGGARSPPSIAHRGRARSLQEVRNQSEDVRSRCQSAPSVHIQDTSNRVKPDPSLTLRSLEKALKDSMKAHGKDSATTAAIYNGIGNSHFRLGHYDEAAQAYKKAVACEPGDHLVSSYTNLATVHWRQGEISEAVHFLQQAWAVHELATLSSGKSMLTSPVAANISHQQGLCHALTGDYDKALEYLHQAQSIRVRIAGPDDVSVGRTLDAIGKVHWMQADLESALEYHSAALTCLTNAHAPTLPILQNIARVHTTAKDLDAAVAVFGEIASIQRNELAHNVPGTQKRRDAAASLSETLKTLADMHDQLGRQGEAIRFRQEVTILMQETK